MRCSFMAQVENKRTDESEADEHRLAPLRTDPPTPALAATPGSPGGGVPGCTVPEDRCTMESAQFIQNLSAQVQSLVGAGVREGWSNHTPTPRRRPGNDSAAGDPRQQRRDSVQSRLGKNVVPHDLQTVGAPLQVGGRCEGRPACNLVGMSRRKGADSTDCRARHQRHFRGGATRIARVRESAHGHRVGDRGSVHRRQHAWRERAGGIGKRLVHRFDPVSAHANLKPHQPDPQPAQGQC